MKQIKKIDNHIVFVRKPNHEEQGFSDYIRENKVYRDGRPDEEFLCLMPHCHSVYFELWVDGKKEQRVGFSQIVDLKKGWENGLYDFFEKDLEKIKSRILLYVSHFYSEVL